MNISGFSGSIWQYRKLSLVAVLLFAGFSGLSPATSANRPLKTKNVFVIVTDGFRWQEVFTGAEEALMNKTNGGVKNVTALGKEFWRETAEARRQALLPFIWSEVVPHGQLYGNQSKGSIARVTNDKRFSYPGYNE